MESKLNKKTSELEITILVDKEQWKKTQDETEKKLINNLSIKGFRKGKIPMDLAKKHIARSQIMQKSVSKIIESLAKKAGESIDKEIVILSAPTYLVNKISDVDLEIKFIYPIFPKFKIGKYMNINVKYAQDKVDSKLIDGELEKIRSSQAMLKDKNEPITKGDYAFFDFEGFIDGKPFDGNKSKNFQLEIGSGKFIPGFEDKMIGLKSKDEKIIEVTFPKDYHDEKLKGKKAKFKILIHEVKIKEKPELNDEFVKTSGIPNVDSLEELKKHIKKTFDEQHRQSARTNFQREAFDKILKETKDLIVPHVLIIQEKNSLREKFTSDLKKQGLEIKQYMEMTNMNEKNFNSQFEEQAISRLKDAFLFGKIAMLENIAIKDEEYDEEYKKLAIVYGKTIEQVKTNISKQQLQIPITNDKVIDLLLKNVGK